MYEQDWPDFIKKYAEEVIIEGYEEFSNLARQYNKAINDLKQEAVKQNLSYSAFNKLFNKNKKYDLEAHLKTKKEQAQADALKIAKKHGHEEPIPKKEELTKEQKTAQAKETFQETKEPLPIKEKKQEPDLTAKQEKHLEAIEIVKERQVVSEKAVDEQSKKDAERAKLIAEMTVFLENKRFTDREP